MVSRHQILSQGRTLHVLPGEEHFHEGGVEVAFAATVEDVDGEHEMMLTVRCDTSAIDASVAQHVEMVRRCRPLLPGEEAPASILEPEILESKFDRPTVLILVYTVQGVSTSLSIDVDGSTQTVDPEHVELMIGSYAVVVRTLVFPNPVFKALGQAVGEDDPPKTYDDDLSLPWSADTNFEFAPPPGALAGPGTLSLWGSDVALELPRNDYDDGSFYLVCLRDPCSGRSVFSASCFETEGRKTLWLILDIVGDAKVVRRTNEGKDLPLDLPIDDGPLRCVDGQQEEPLNIWVRRHPGHAELPPLGLGDKPDEDEFVPLKRIDMLPGITAMVHQALGMNHAVLTPSQRRTWVYGALEDQPDNGRGD